MKASIYTVFQALPVYVYNIARSPTYSLHEDDIEANLAVFEPFIMYAMFTLFTQKSAMAKKSYISSWMKPVPPAQRHHAHDGS